MIERKFVIEYEDGLHARPAARFTKIASGFKSEIRIIKDSKTGNGKSLLSVLSLGIFKDTHIRVEIIGPDESEAMCVIAKLLTDGLSSD